jgi:hypothetical protein
MGVTSLVSFNLHARLNGEYFGKFAYVEQLDEDTLQVGCRCRCCCCGGCSGR